MGKIEVGEYIRTKSGVIIKADFIDFERLTISQRGIGYDFEDTEEMEDFIKNEIVKHSKNIIDLIEVGDYLDILADGEPLRFEVDKIDQKHKLKNIANEIKIRSIVTKEQFASMEYKVGE